MQHVISRRSLAVVAYLAAAVACAPALAEAQRVEGSFERTLTVGAQPDLDIVTGSGRIEVRQGPAGRVEIRARILASDQWLRRRDLSPAERVRRIEADPPVEQTGDTIRIGHSVPQELRDGVSISYVLTVPAASTLLTRTGSGSQHVEGIEGDVTASAGSGSLTFKAAGRQVRASTGSGSITAETVKGGFHGTTGSGSIRASGVGGSITAKTGSGSIDVEQTGSGDVEVSSGSGAVRLRGVNGALRASTSSGGIAVQGELAGDWRLSASSGRVRVTLPPGHGFQLDAGTGSGRIDVAVPVTVTGSTERRALRGTVLGGGPLLHVRTSSGSIQIQ